MEQLTDRNVINARYQT